MIPLDLNIPPLIHQAAPDDTPESLRAWLDGLPKLNQNEFAQTLNQRLQRFNQTVVEPLSRHAAMSAFAIEAEHLIERFCTQCGQVNFPLKPEKIDLYEQAQTLLEQMANGYKLLAMQLAKRPHELTPQERAVLHESLLRGIEYLSRQVLVAYTIYRDAPPGLWQEIHRLYRFAEGHDLATERVEHMSDWSMGIAYTQIVMAALCNPFHLFQNEIHDVYARLRKWAGAVRMRFPDEFDADLKTLTAERYFIDLDSDGPPRHGIAGQPGAPAATRLLDIHELERIVADRVKALTQRKDLSYRELQERDLLRRLRNAWSRRATRGEQREGVCAQAVVVAGLTPAHYYLSGSSEFDPETFEIHMHGDRMQADNGLSLVPLEQESWREADIQRKLEQGVIKPRSYNFDYGSRDDDVWKKANIVSGGRTKSEIETSLEQRITRNMAPLQTQDESRSGFGFTCPGHVHININVGSLLAVQECRDSDRWCLAVIRWMRTNPDLSLSLGARMIPGETRAVAARGVEGQGAHTQYQRCIVLTDGETRSYIVPAGLFHVGSKILLNDGERLRLLKLTRLAEMTKSYNRYLGEELELNEARREQVVQSLYKLLHNAQTE